MKLKHPLPSASLVYENNKTPATQSMYEEILNIENFVEQSLYYALQQLCRKRLCYQVMQFKRHGSNHFKTTFQTVN